MLPRPDDIDNPDKSLPTISTNKSRLFMPFDFDDPDYPDPDDPGKSSKRNIMLSAPPTPLCPYALIILLLSVRHAGPVGTGTVLVFLLASPPAPHPRAREYVVVLIVFTCGGVCEGVLLHAVSAHLHALPPANASFAEALRFA